MYHSRLIRLTHSQSNACTLTVGVHHKIVCRPNTLDLWYRLSHTVHENVVDNKSSYADVSRCIIHLFNLISLLSWRLNLLFASRISQYELIK